MISDFDTAPMASNEGEPLRRGIAISRTGRQVVSRGFVFWIFEGGRVASHPDDRLDMGEIDV